MCRMLISFRKTIRNAHQTVRAATQRAAKTEKSYFDRFVKGPPFAVGQYVWLYWPQPLLRPRMRKLTRVWTGPWQILEFKTSIVAVVQNMKTKKKQTVHVDRLVPCNNHVLPVRTLFFSTDIAFDTGRNVSSSSANRRTSRVRKLVQFGSVIMFRISRGCSLITCLVINNSHIGH